MQRIGAFYAKTHFSAILEKVEKGEQVIITKHGHAVAKLIPTGKHDKEHVRATIIKLKAFAKSNTLGDLDWKDLRDQGRK